jgi:hypothetical protein
MAKATADKAAGAGARRQSSKRCGQGLQRSRVASIETVAPMLDDGALLHGHVPSNNDGRAVPPLPGTLVAMNGPNNGIVGVCVQMNDNRFKVVPHKRMEKGFAIQAPRPCEIARDPDNTFGWFETQDEAQAVVDAINALGPNKGLRIFKQKDDKAS